MVAPKDLSKHVDGVYHTCQELSVNLDSVDWGHDNYLERINSTNHEDDPAIWSSVQALAEEHMAAVWVELKARNLQVFNDGRFSQRYWMGQPLLTSLGLRR
ncbi:hypothetical protein ACHAPJ_005901 [Fusarium lateritium]